MKNAVLISLMMTFAFLNNAFADYPSRTTRTHLYYKGQEAKIIYDAIVGIRDLPHQSRVPGFKKVIISEDKFICFEPTNYQHRNYFCRISRNFAAQRSRHLESPAKKLWRLLPNTAVVETHERFQTYRTKKLGNSLNVVLRTRPQVPQSKKRYFIENLDEKNTLHVVEIDRSKAPVLYNSFNVPEVELKPVGQTKKYSKELGNILCLKSVITTPQSNSVRRVYNCSTAGRLLGRLK